tara:strand:- start:845 stop:1654 length:810 start_codon:yes stop_codon:yes gene_type:complete
LRRRDEDPVNPFAQGSSRSNRKPAGQKKTTKQPVKRRPSPTKPANDSRAELEKKRKEALNRMKGKQAGNASGPAKAGGGERSDQTKNVLPEKTEIKQETREDRLADLERKKRTMEGDLSVKPALTGNLHESGKTPSEEAIASVLPPAEPVNIFAPKAARKSKSLKPGEGGRPRRRGAREKKGGGRQPQVKKLDRRKYLEYKYEVRELLDNPAIPEENRSNILGQIWAKGERTGIDDAIQFINTKVSELILPEEVAEKLRELVKGYTTRR